MFPDSNRTDSAADRIRFHFFMQFFLLLSFSFLMLPIIYEESAIRIPFRYRLTFCSLPSKWYKKEHSIECSSFHRYFIPSTALPDRLAVPLLSWQAFSVSNYFCRICHMYSCYFFAPHPIQKNPSLTVSVQAGVSTT